MSLKSDIDKEKLIEALKNSGGIIVDACELAGINRENYYYYKRTDPDFKKEVEEIIPQSKEWLVDLAESSLVKNLKEGNQMLTMYVLNNHGKSKGYAKNPDNSTGDNERVSININGINENAI